MAKKEFTYRGKTLEELKEMSLKEFSMLLPARMRRSINRGFTEQQKILIENLKENDDVKTHCRNMIVLPDMVGKVVRIHTGKSFARVELIPETIGHFFGELALTRGRVQHSAPGVGATRSSLRIGAK